jgi:hypothetical protein
MNGPFRAGLNDVTVFSNKGSKAKLRAHGKKGIGDGGCSGRPEEMSTPNSHDSKQVFKFESRALKRMCKNFDCLDGRFWHSVDCFKNCFEAMCVICQHQMENNRPLHAVLIDDGIMMEQVLTWNATCHRLSLSLSAACVIPHCQGENKRPLLHVLIDDGIMMEQILTQNTACMSHAALSYEKCCFVWDNPHRPWNNMKRKKQTLISDSCQHQTQRSSVHNRKS